MQACGTHPKERHALLGHWGAGSFLRSAANAPQGLHGRTAAANAGAAALSLEGDG
jgi:hypothetical protein